MPPFRKNAAYLSVGDVERLRDWLEKECDPDTLLASDYSVGDMVSDLDKILDGMWSDGIDARGEDA